MEEQKKGSGAILWTVAVVVIALGAFGGYKYMKGTTESVVGTPVVQDTTGTVPTVQTPTLLYKDGSYSATGSYISPGGSESIAVTLTLKDDVVTSANVISQATRKESKEWQAKFISGVNAQVVGKKVDDIALTKVSGSSLTPKGFMDALNQIEAQAKA
ncbi:MAG: FMN-binding protein [Parcubacteria bacterium C7867-006]|nr:MAG: FMN-binding protein [Parcubacteria bacterium C7867-006]